MNANTVSMLACIITITSRVYIPTRQLVSTGRERGTNGGESEIVEQNCRKEECREGEKDRSEQQLIDLVHCRLDSFPEQIVLFPCKANRINSHPIRERNNEPLKILNSAPSMLRCQENTAVARR